MCLYTFYATYVCFPYTLATDLELIVMLLLEYGKNLMYIITLKNELGNYNVTEYSIEGIKSLFSM
jgi:hypothetical protein